MSNSTTVVTTASSSTPARDMAAASRRLADCLARLDAAIERLTVALAKWGVQ
jgi:hypothetical protein